MGSNRRWDEMMMKFRPVKGRRIKEVMRGREKEWRSKSGGILVGGNRGRKLTFVLSSSWPR